MLKLHYLNVGHGDCMIIEFGDTNRVAMIDINRSADMDTDTANELISESLEKVDSLTKSYFTLGIIDKQALLEKAGYSIEVTDPIQYLNDKGIKSIFRFISTHPHMDHISGLNELFSKCSIANIWVVKNDFIIDEKNLTDSEKLDWKLYKSFRDSTERTLNGVTIVRPLSGNSQDFWNIDNIEILAPDTSLLKIAKDKNNQNIMSYVILITYGSHKIIFGGDAEEATWKYIMETYPDKIKDVTILDASHHGRDSGYYQPAVKHMNPKYTLVSVGKKPSTDASNKYRQYCENVWSTRWKGNIYFELNKDGTGTYDTQYDR